MRKLFLIILVLPCLVLCAPCSCDNGNPQDAYPAMRYVRSTVLGIPVNLVYVNLNNPGVGMTAAVAKGGIGRSESFNSFMRRLQPSAAINGTFFSKSNKRPIGDIVIEGRRVHFGGMGAGVCVAEGNRVSFVKVPWGRNFDWSGYRTVVCCGPRLVSQGNVCVDARGEGFRDSHVLGRGVRTAVGLTNRNRLLLLNTRAACSLGELAKVMQSLGCTDAINFDGGASTAMYYKGRTITTPGRELTNVLVVYEARAGN